MTDSIMALDQKKHEIVFKWQLWRDHPEGSPPDLEELRWSLFEYAYSYAHNKGYATTASVFDAAALKFLLSFEIPFVKIAGRSAFYPLIDFVPRGVPVLVSASDYSTGEALYSLWNVDVMYCISQYPASKTLYETTFGGGLYRGISDHTDSVELWHEYRPLVYEKHLKLEDSTGYDAKAHAVLPEAFGTILAKDGGEL
jgi:sialic acid synthase SpsE